jgi:hypothetical protein
MWKKVTRGAGMNDDEDQDEGGKDMANARTTSFIRRVREQIRFESVPLQLQEMEEELNALRIRISLMETQEEQAIETPGSTAPESIETPELKAPESACD